MTAKLGPLHLDPSQHASALHSVLHTLQLEHRQNVALSGYTAEAVLEQKSDSGISVSVAILSKEAFFENIPDR